MKMLCNNIKKTLLGIMPTNDNGRAALPKSVMEKRVSTLGWYSRINSTKSLALGAGNISKLMLMSQFRRVGEVSERRSVCFFSRSCRRACTRLLKL